MSARQLAERFWEKVDRRGPDECWLWLAAKGTKGHGLFWPSGRLVGAHRFAYELLIGPIPDGLTLDHFRLNPGPRKAPCSPACVNPAHLEPVTSVENVLRGHGITAENVRKTHCPYGHPFNDSPRGWRECRTCRLAASARHREKERQLRAATA